MNSLLIACFLAFSPPTGNTLDDAKVLYQEGTVLYESADYLKAIDKFTKALGIVVSIDGADHIRLTLLYNIASAHEKAFELDKDILHLRQALLLYKRYLEFAKQTDNLGDELEVEVKIVKLEKRLEIYNQIEQNKNSAEKLPLPSAPLTNTQWKKTRGLGIGLTISGSMALLGGVSMIAIGSQYETKAQDQVANLAGLGVPSDHPAWDEGNDFIAQEKRKGAMMMGIGVSTAIVGMVGTGVGAYYLSKAKKIRHNQISLSPTLSSQSVGIRVTGRF